MESKKLIGLIGISLIAFVDFLEYTVVNTALPTIQQAFHAQVLQLQWVMNIYFLVVSVSMMLVGRLGDIYGRRLVFFLGALILGLASIGAGMSHTIEQLIFCRAFQAIGVAASVTLAPALIYTIFRDDNQQAMGIYAMVTGVGLTIGPALGGYLVEHFGWPWIFYVNVPLLLVAFVCCARFIPESKSKVELSIDRNGALLLVVALGGLIYGLIHGAQVAWHSSLTWLPILASAIALPILVKYENQQASPVMNFHFFKKPIFMLSALLCAVVGILSTVALFFDPLFLSYIKGYSPKLAGLFLLMVPAAIVIFAPIVGKLLKQISSTVIMLAGLIVGLCSAILHMYFTGTSPISLFIVAFFLVGMAWTVCNVVPAMAVQTVVEPEQAGVAIGTIFSMFNIFSAIMLAVTAVVFHMVSGLDQSVGNKLAFISGFHAAFILLSCILLLSALYGIYLWRSIAMRAIVVVDKI